MKVVVDIEGKRRLVRLGRDGKNRFCIYYFTYSLVAKRCVIASGLTKSAAYGLLKLLEGS